MKRKMLYIVCLFTVAWAVLFAAVGCSGDGSAVSGAGASSSQTSVDAQPEASESAEAEPADKDTIGGESGEEADIRTEYQYDDQGRVILQSDIYPDGSAAATEYAYDAKGNVVKESCTFSGSDGIAQLLMVQEYEYDSAGNLTRIISEDDTGITEYDYTYNDEGLQQSWDVYENGEHVEHHTLEYDDQGILVRKTHECLVEGYNLTIIIMSDDIEPGEVIPTFEAHKYIEECDAEGNVIYADYYNEAGELLEEHGVSFF